MIIFNIRLGRLSVLAIREGDRQKCCGFTREPGEIILDMPFASITFTNYRKAEAL